MSPQRQRPIDFATEGLLLAHRVSGNCGIRVYERKPGLEPEKKLMLAVLEDAIGFENLSVQRRRGRRNGFWKRRNDLARRKASGYSASRTSVRPYDLILSTFGAT
jgi:transposase